MPPSVVLNASPPLYPTGFKLNSPADSTKSVKGGMVGPESDDANVSSKLIYAHCRTIAVIVRAAPSDEPLTNLRYRTPANIAG